MNILQTRLIHWQKQWVSLLFWLLLPVIATLLIILLTNAVQENSKVPVGIVLQEKTPLAMSLYDAIQQTTLIRVENLDEHDAQIQLEKHQLDSVFVIHDGYEENIRKGSRNHLITSYHSDLSFAYTPVKEMIVSYVQQDTGRSKAAYIVKELSNTYGDVNQWHWEDVVAKSIDIQKKENLLRTTFKFTNQATTATERNIIQFNTWGLWSLFNILTTFMLFDWLIKEKRASILPRFAFIRISVKNYILLNILWYTILFVIFDLLALLTFYLVIGEPISISLIVAMFSYRITLIAATFVLTTCFKNLYLYYSTSFALVLLLAISSGAILPIESMINQVPWLEYLNPLYPFLQKNIVNLWLLLFIGWIICWYVRKEKFDASY